MSLHPLAERLADLRLRNTIHAKVDELRQQAFPRPLAPADDSDDGLTWIYFVQAASSGRIKIGVARDLSKRLRNLQTSSPEPLRLLATLRAAPEIEAELHERFSAARCHGEWFEPSPALLAYIAEIAE